jgi:hypothetical protein
VHAGFVGDAVGADVVIVGKAATSLRPPRTSSILVVSPPSISLVRAYPVVHPFLNPKRHVVAGFVKFDVCTARAGLFPPHPGSS